MGLQALKPRIALANLRTAALPPKVADPFYSTQAWIALRDRVRREAGGRCQVAGCGRIERGMIVDHIVELVEAKAAAIEAEAARGVVEGQQLEAAHVESFLDIAGQSPQLSSGFRLMESPLL